MFVEGLVKGHAKLMREFYDFVFKTYRANKVPIYFIKYEEFLSDTETVLKDLYSFLLNVKSVEGTVVAARIKEVMEMDSRKRSPY